MGEASVPEGTVKAFEPKTADDPQILEMLRDMATNEAGWAQIGGKWMGKAEKGSGVPNFTTWIPKAEWWNDRPDKKMNEAKFVEAVTKHMTDEKMTPAEKRITWRRISTEATAWRFNRYAERAQDNQTMQAGN